MRHPAYVYDGELLRLKSSCITNRESHLKTLWQTATELNYKSLSFKSYTQKTQPQVTAYCLNTFNFHWALTPIFKCNPSARTEAARGNDICYRQARCKERRQRVIRQNGSMHLHSHQQLFYKA